MYYGGCPAKSPTVNWFLFGLLTQQFYSYWIGGEFLLADQRSKSLTASRFQGPETHQVSHSSCRVLSELTFTEPLSLCSMASLLSNASCMYAFLFLTLCLPTDIALGIAYWLGTYCKASLHCQNQLSMSHVASLLTVVTRRSVQVCSSVIHARSRSLPSQHSRGQELSLHCASAFSL